MYAVAQNAALEIRTYRPSYRKPIVSTLSIGPGAPGPKTTLPTGLVTDVDHLTNFFWLTITNSPASR